MDALNVVKQGWEGRVGTPVRILEGTTGTFKWDNLRQVCFRDRIQQAGFGESNRG